MTTPGASDDAALSRDTPGRPRPPTEVDELRADIAHTRAELGETVQALAARADVKARLQETTDEAKARLREGLQSAAAEARSAAAEAPHAVRRNPVPFVVAVGAVALIVVLVQWRRRSR